jgi:hypothetical protein
VKYLEPRDTRPILASIASITKALQEETTALTALSRNPNSRDVVSTLVNKAHTLTGELRNAATTVATGPNVELFEAVGLTMPLTGLNSASDAAIAAWVSAKTTIVKSGGKDQVLDILREQSVVADKYSDVVVAKMPEIYKYLGNQFGASLSKKLHNAIEQFRAA